MNSALKPVLSQTGVSQPSNQASPAKATVATANHAVGLPQGAINSLHHTTNNLVGQNLSHQLANTPAVPPHAAPSMAPVSANMAQMAANMSHHGNLSHVTQNAAPVTNNVVSPTKSASTSAPLSLVQEKITPAQPLALTRSPEKKEPDSTGHANGTVESPAATNDSTPTLLKPENSEPQLDKQDITKTSPSTPKPPENNSAQKPESSNTVNQPESPVQPKVATANEPIKSPAKPSELKTTPTADVAPIGNDKPLVESASDNQTSDKQTPSDVDTTPSIIDTKDNEKEEESEPIKDKKKEEEVKLEPVSEEPTKEVNDQANKEVNEKPELESKTVTKAETKTSSKSTLKLATVTPPLRKRRHLSDKVEGATPVKKSEATAETPNSRTKRNRTQVQLYQASGSDIVSSSPGPSSASKPKDQSSKKAKDKLRLFVSGEYVAVRNEDNSYYVCQLLQNVYRTTGSIRIRWLSRVTSNSAGDVYKHDYCEQIDVGCLMTTLDMKRVSGGYLMKAEDRGRVLSILQRALRAAEQGATSVELPKEHPDGVDVTLVTDESELEVKSRKRPSSKTSPRVKSEPSSKESEEETTPAKKARSSKSKTKTPKKSTKSAGSTPSVASTGKTATTVTDTPKNKNNKNNKKTPKKETPTATPSKGRRSARESKSTPMSPEPSTSTGKGTRANKRQSK